MKRHCDYASRIIEIDQPFIPVFFLMLSEINGRAISWKDSSWNYYAPIEVTMLVRSILPNQKTHFYDGGFLSDCLNHPSPDSNFAINSTSFRPFLRDRCGFSVLLTWPHLADKQWWFKGIDPGYLKNFLTHGRIQSRHRSGVCACVCVSAEKTAWVGRIGDSITNN